MEGKKQYNVACFRRLWNCLPEKKRCQIFWAALLSAILLFVIVLVLSLNSSNEMNEDPKALQYKVSSYAHPNA